MQTCLMLAEHRKQQLKPKDQSKGAAHLHALPKVYPSLPTDIKCQTEAEEEEVQVSPVCEVYLMKTTLKAHAIAYMLGFMACWH